MALAQTFAQFRRVDDPSGQSFLVGYYTDNGVQREFRLPFDSVSGISQAVERVEAAATAVEQNQGAALAAAVQAVDAQDVAVAAANDATTVLASAVKKTELSTPSQTPVGGYTGPAFQSILDNALPADQFGAVNNATSGASNALAQWISEAISTSGYAKAFNGDYRGKSIAINGGLRLEGTVANSVLGRAQFLQESLEDPLFAVSSITFHAEELAHSVFAGNLASSSGAPITVVSVGTNSMTLSADPWTGQSPIIWQGVNYPATDGTNYPNAIRLSVNGAWVASSATKNGDGTVTLSGVRGADATLTSNLPGTVGKPLELWVSLAHRVQTPPANPKSAIYFMDVRENQMFDAQWFHQVYTAEYHDETGSGGGVDTGIGNTGLRSRIFIDQARYYIRAAGSIQGLQMTNSQAYDVYRLFSCVDDFLNNVITDLLLWNVQRAFDVGGDMTGCVISGLSCNPSEGNGYINGHLSVGGTVKDTLISGNLYGRADNSGPVMTINSADGLNFSGNTIISWSEGSNGPFLRVTGSTFKNCYVGGNNFLNKYSSSDLFIQFDDPNCDISGTVFAQPVVVSGISPAKMDYELDSSPGRGVMYTTSSKQRIWTNGRQGVVSIAAVTSLTLSPKDNYVIFGNQIFSNRSFSVNATFSDPAQGNGGVRFIFDFRNAIFNGNTLTITCGAATVAVVSTPKVIELVSISAANGYYAVIG